MIKEERRKKKHKKMLLRLFKGLLAAAAVAAVIIWNVFRVENVVVEGNQLYTAEQIQNMVLNDDYSWNSMYVYIKYQFKDVGEVPFVDDMTVTLQDPHTLLVSVYEKGILGKFYIEAIGQNAYFDKDGFVVETSSREIEDVPRITGVTCSEVTLYEQLSLEQQGILKKLLSLTQTLKKYDLLPEEIHYNENFEAVLTYENIRVYIGNSEFLSQKVARLAVILPQLDGLSGKLHLETWTADTTDIVFERDK